MIMTEKPKHYTDYAWREYQDFMAAQPTRNPGHKILLTMGSHMIGGIPSEVYATWARESGLYTERSLGTNAYGQECLEFTKI